MKRSHALALSALTLFLATSASSQAQSLRPGEQCQPAVANASMYGNCRLRIVSGQEVCRCAILPGARRLLNLGDRSDTTTGSIASRSVSDVSSFSNSGPTSLGLGGAGSGTGRAGSAGGMASSGASGSRGFGGAVAGNVSGGASAGGSVSGPSGNASGLGNNGNGQGPGNNNGLGNGSEPADNTSTDVKGTDPSNPGGGNGHAGASGGRGGNGGGNGRL